MEKITLRAVFFRHHVIVGAVLAAAVLGTSNSSSAAEDRPADCELTVRGKTYIKGVCQFRPTGGGGFRISGNDYFANVSITAPGVAEASWNESPQSTHAHSNLGTLNRKGACWVGANATICARELSPEKAKAVAAAPAQPVAQSNAAGGASCPRGETPLPLTGLCPGAAQAAFLAKPKTPTYRDKACRWVVNETAMHGGEVLLYLAQRCGNQTATLALSGNPKAPRLVSRTEAFGEDVKMQGFPVDPRDDMRTIIQVARAAIKDPAKAKLCSAELQKDGQRIIVDMPLRQARKFIPDGPTGGLCGDFGFNDDGSHWRVFGGMAWYFQLGQDLWQSIDTDNVILLRRDPAGGDMNGWRVKY